MRVSRHVDAQASPFDLLRGQPLLQLGDRIQRTGGDAQVGRVDGGDVEIQAGHQAAQLRLRKVDRQHCARRRGFEQPTPQHHHRQRVRQRHHARQASRRVLAGAVADDRGGCDAPALPQLRQGIFKCEQGRDRVAGTLQRAHGGCIGGIAVEHHGAQIVRRVCRHQAETFVDRLDEARLAEEFTARAGVVRAAAGKNQHHARRVGSGIVGDRAKRVGRGQCEAQASQIARDECTSILE